MGHLFVVTLARQPHHGANLGKNFLPHHNALRSVPPTHHFGGASIIRANCMKLRNKAKARLATPAISGNFIYATIAVLWPEVWRKHAFRYFVEYDGPSSFGAPALAARTPAHALKLF